MKKKKTKEVISASICWDWKEQPDMDTLRDQLNKLLKPTGVKLRCYDDPNFDGSDMYGYIFTLKEMTLAEIREETRLD